MISKWKIQFDDLLAKAAREDLLGPAGTNKATLAAKRRNTSANKKRGPGGGRKGILPLAVTQELKKYFDARRELDLSVSLRGLIVECFRIDPVSASASTPIALRNRLYRLLKKADISYRRSTHKAQNTRHCMIVINHFLDYIHRKINMMDVSEEDIFNCDQNNCFYSMEGAYTYAAKGSKTVALLGAESTARCTIMLGVNKTGSIKLPPYIIFKGVNSPTGRIIKEIERKTNLPLDCEYGVQTKAWMDEEQMLRWIKIVWIPFTGAREGRRTFLILDECRTHMTAKIGRAFALCNTEVEFIPGGYTAKLQPMDVGINKPFKNYVRRFFDSWLVRNIDNTRPMRQDVSKWISDAWKDITPATIMNSWRKVGIDDAKLNTAQPDLIDEEGDEGEDLYLEGYFDESNNDENPIALY
jgi:hypothetical protein